MSDASYQPIFDYIDESNKKLKEEILQEVKIEINDVKTSVANLSSQVKKYMKKC